MGNLFYLYAVKVFGILLALFSCMVSAQRDFPFDSIKVRDAEDFLVDDYGNIYLYKSGNFSFTKYDSLGKELGRQMMTVPFQIQSVQNPLTIFLFSRNAQQLKLLDQNLNEVQRVDFQQKFGFIVAAYAEDLQQIWLLDAASKRLIQYNYRADQMINSYPLDIDFDEINKLIVFANTIYLITENSFKVYDFRGNVQFTKNLEHPIKLRKENDVIYIFTNDAAYSFDSDGLFSLNFSAPSARIVDKNSFTFFEVKGNKFYLYNLENEADN